MLFMPHSLLGDQNRSYSIVWYTSYRHLLILDTPKLHCSDKEEVMTVQFSIRLHVRRTDKKAEARYHNIEEYMVHVSCFSEESYM